MNHARANKMNLIRDPNSISVPREFILKTDKFLTADPDHYNG